MDFQKLLNKFGIVENPISFRKIEKGHINLTYIAELSNSSVIIQSINRSVFKDYKAVMHNIELTEQIFKKNHLSNVTVPFYFHTPDGHNYYKENDDIFRIYRFIPSIECKCSPYHTGKTYGSFIKIIEDGKNKKTEYAVSLPDFHNFSAYFKKLTILDKESKLKKIDKSILIRMSALENTLNSVFDCYLTKRIVHNDAKSDNIIAGNPVCIIDLDTVMNGYAAIDYGDMVRSVTSSDFSLNTIKQITEGFADGLNGLLTEEEVVSLYFGILYVTGELAVRYLSDYIGNINYFKDKTPSMCLSRANELFNQLNTFTKCQDDITAIIYKAFKKK